MPVAGMLMDRVTRLLGPARGGEGIFLEGRVSEFGIRSGGRARGHQKFLLPLGFRLDFRPCKRRGPRQPLGAAWTFQRTPVPCVQRSAA